MSHWNYRIMQRVYPNGYISYGLYEIYYDDKNRITSWTKDSMVGEYDSAEELEREIAIMLAEAIRNRNCILNYDMKPEIEK